jgi:NADH dehydrogenase (ubiquinone) Fe-S protein 6
MDQPPESANSLPPPEIFRVKTLQVACDGSGQIDPALGHPRVFLRMEPELGWVECGYCDRRFVLEGGPADQEAA